MNKCDANKCSVHVHYDIEPHLCYFHYRLHMESKLDATTRALLHMLEEVGVSTATVAKAADELVAEMEKQA